MLLLACAFRACPPLRPSASVLHSLWNFLIHEYIGHYGHGVRQMAMEKLLWTLIWELQNINLIAGQLVSSDSRPDSGTFDKCVITQNLIHDHAAHGPIHTFNGLSV